MTKLAKTHAQQVEIQMKIESQLQFATLDGSHEDDMVFTPDGLES